MNIQIKSLTVEMFKRYGQVVKPPETAEPTIATDDLTYWKQQATIRIDGDVEVGILKVKKHEMLFDQMEKHNETPEMLVALDADFIVPVAPPSEDIPSVEQIEVFHVKHGQAIIMDTACWHGGPNPLDKNEVTILVIFKDNTSQNDLVIKELSETCKGL